ncbi:putative transporter [Fonsecaea pedrosoi]|nr:putative transporter [Fonsecaea pedrosoi]
MVATPLDEEKMDKDDSIAEEKDGQDNIPEANGHLREKHSQDSVKVERLGADADNDDDSGDEEEPPVVIERVFSRRSMASDHPHQHQHHHHQPLTDLDHGIVGWDGPDDPENPLNFPRPRKWALLGLVSAITFVSPLASSMFAPAVGFLGEDFGVHQELVLSFTVSVYLLGIWLGTDTPDKQFGPLVLAPLSEIYGRRIVLCGANIFFVVWQIGCALAPNVGGLIAFRFLAGIGGSGCLTLGAGVIADLFVVEERGLATSIWSLGPLFGPVVGPICGGFVAQQIGWRWVFWILLIASASTTIGIELLNKETYARVLIRWKTQRLAKTLGRSDLVSWFDREKGPVGPKRTLMDGMRRPLQMLVKYPIVMVLSGYMSLVYGLLYLLFTTITFVFEQQYGFSPQITGLAYLGIGIGFFLGAGVIAATSDRMVIKLTKRNNGQFEPEMRMPLMIIFACFIPVSFFWYGWAADKKVHWIVPIIGMVPFSFGMMGVFLPIQTYLIDCYPTYAASAIAILTATRSLVGALLPLAGPPMYDALGLGWGNSLLGFVALACIPIPLVLERYGKQIRSRDKLVL